MAVVCIFFVSAELAGIAVSQTGSRRHGVLFGKVTISVSLPKLDRAMTAIEVSS
jgi:hypothetical protein